MTVYSPKFAIPLMTDNPLSPDAIFNQAILILDMLASDTAIAYTATPPGSPVNGDIYIIAAGATGVWATRDEQMAFYFDGWAYRPAPTNKRVFVTASSVWYYKTVTVWLPDSTAGIGKHTIWIPASALISSVTNGAAYNSVETTTNVINYAYMAFSPTTSQFGWFSIPIPKSFALSTISFKAHWTHSTGGTAFGVVWRLQAVSFNDADAIDTALGTGVDVSDTGGTAGILYRTGESTAVTPSNTPAKGDLLLCRVARMTADGADTLDIDARLIGIEVYYNTDAGTDN